jgi:predicted ATP-grasp superfamily ATP-dependent carboligase
MTIAAHLLPTDSDNMNPDPYGAKVLIQTCLEMGGTVEVRS